MGWLNGLWGMRRHSRAAALQRSLHTLHCLPSDLDTSVGRKLSVVNALNQEQHPGLTGLWRKNKARSDRGIEEAFVAVRLPFLYRKAVGFLNYLEVEHTAEIFRTTLKAGGLMDVEERYPTDGAMVLHKRRDKRRGHHSGLFTLTPEGWPQLQIEWGDPYAGKEDGASFTQMSDMIMRETGQHISYRTVYDRALRRS